MAKIERNSSRDPAKKGSDLHFLAAIRRASASSATCWTLRPEKLAPDFVKDCLYEIMPKQAVRRFDRRTHRFAHHVPGMARFRVNVMRQLNGMGAVFRSFHSTALSLDQPAVVTECETVPANNQGDLAQSRVRQWFELVERQRGRGNDPKHGAMPFSCRMTFTRSGPCPVRGARKSVRPSIRSGARPASA